MNTLCQKCRKVNLLGHHRCESDGMVVKIRVLPPRWTDRLWTMDTLRLPTSFDSATRNTGKIDVHQTLILGGDYYGLSAEEWEREKRRNWWLNKLVDAWTLYGQ